MTAFMVDDFWRSMKARRLRVALALGALVVASAGVLVFNASDKPEPSRPSAPAVAASPTTTAPSPPAPLPSRALPPPAPPKPTPPMAAAKPLPPPPREPHVPPAELVLTRQAPEPVAASPPPRPRPRPHVVKASPPARSHAEWNPEAPLLPH
jgi:hypothetical protein